jgi:peptidoglycan/LPS O-acetylase OafA/YrhL
LRHRAEIDGLRAIAVLPVMLFHAGAKGFEGGFIGVDIFFVISGYLITAIILRELAALALRDSMRDELEEFFQLSMPL